MEGSEDRVFNNPEDLPSDMEVATKQSKVFEPLPADIYQVEVLSLVVKENPFWKPKDDDGNDTNPVSKYQLNQTLVIIEEGKNYGRRVWDNMAPVVKPSGKKGASKAYKFITAILETELTWEECEGFAPNPQVFYKNMKELVGRQVRVSLETKITESNKKKNIVASYLPVKAQLPSFDESKVAKQ